MKKLKAKLSGTMVDRQGERIPLETLQEMAKTTSRAYVPVGVEHDPRIRPQGRIVSAEVLARSDGEYDLMGTMEIFEEGDSASSDGRAALVPHIQDDALHIIADRSYRISNLSHEIRDLGTFLNAKLESAFNKSLDPLSLLVLGAAGALGALAHGFFAKIGEDLWAGFEVRLKSLFGKTEAIAQERLLCFRFTASDRERLFTAEVVLSSPGQADIEWFLQTGLWLLDELTQVALNREPDLVRAVYEVRDAKLIVLYGVKENGFPVDLK